MASEGLLASIWRNSWGRTATALKIWRLRLWIKRVEAKAKMIEVIKEEVERVLSHKQKRNISVLRVDYRGAVPLLCHLVHGYAVRLRSFNSRRQREIFGFQYSKLVDSDQRFMMF